MLIFNTTFHVEEDVHTDFLEYMQTIYIPAATKSNLLRNPQLAKVYGSDEDQGHSYALQFEVDNPTLLEKWNKAEGTTINRLLLDRYNQKIVGFTTVLRKIELEQR